MLGDEAGFTLIEVLVAFIIAALALGVLFQGSITGLKSTRVSVHEEEALSRARSHLAALMVQPFGAGGTQSGDDGGGFHWQTQEAPLGVDPMPGPAGTAMPALYGLQATISWRMDGAVRQVTLHGERLVSARSGSP